MLDLTVDTNVLAHVNNPAVGELQRDAVEFVKQLLAEGARTMLCVDIGFHTEEARNRSAIWSEYLHHALRGNALAQQLMVHLISGGRLKEVSISNMGTNVNRRVRTHVSDPTDRKFIKVALRSTTHTFITHDFACFSEEVCASLSAELGVTVLPARDCPPLT